MAGEIVSGIKHLVALKIKEKLQEACVDDLLSTDVSRADVVTLRTSKQTGKEVIVLTIKHINPTKIDSGGDIALSGWGEASQIFKGWPDRLSGGYSFETICGIVEARFDFTRTRENTEESDRITQLVLGRVKAKIRSGYGIIGLVDEFGEHCCDFRVIGGMEYDSGSETSNTSRYFLRWAALTLAVPTLDE